ncbi:alanine/glycine:cation symporter family protein [Marinifaba aquimaris]|uniref:alanine/glycine:cation symporter family protein n=1 Tax=Marinifaba aquimaris TaxID=2741323 RepID=UPI001C2DA746|nr:amino acid carrier protein [Marinifaba aquimaris]
MDLTSLVNAFVNLVWGAPMLILLVGGGVFFTCYAKLAPFRYIKHSFALLTGKYDDKHSQGDLTHQQALSAALAGTIGLGNVAGVAMAITAGGPGAIFWMWVTALLGVSTKFFTCTLGVMYRGKDSEGKLQGGPMYIVEKGLGEKWMPLAILFAVAGLMGTIPAFQVNQLTEIVRLQVLPVIGVADVASFNLLFGLLVAVFVGAVIWGGIGRVADWATRLVPSMTVLYLLATIIILFNHFAIIPSLFASIIIDAWQPQAAVGGLLGIIIIGVSRGAFSNEAGIGTEVMAHGAAKTNEPVREGLVASLGPIIDTLIVCTCTALIILASGVWQQAEGMQGIALTMQAFEQELGLLGQIILAALVLVLSFTTIFTYWYYGDKCFSYLFGADKSPYFKYFYLAMVVLGAVLSLDLIFNFMVGMYGLMAIPTMTATLILAPKVVAASKDYFARLK